MADDVVDTIAQYDLDDDFPDYANEQNKELNHIVRQRFHEWLISAFMDSNCYCVGEREGPIGGSAGARDRRTSRAVESAG